MGQVVYDNDRPEMLRYVPDDVTSVLDVGCATGHFGETLRVRRPGAVLTGIDPMPHDPSRPEVYDSRIIGFYPQDLPADARYDCIVFNDVLEHMVDPWTTLVDTRERLTEGGCVVASIPNVRHLLVLLPLVLQGRWTYDDHGILDRTHLRFFTASSIQDLFESSGYEVVCIEPARVTKPNTLGRLSRMLGGRFTGFITHQYAVVARPNA